MYLDYIDKLPVSQRRNKYLLVVIDGFSGWPEDFPTKNNAAVIIAKKLYQEAFYRFSTLRILSSDKGSTFASEVIRKMTNAIGIHKKLHSKGDPRVLKSGTL